MDPQVEIIAWLVFMLIVTVLVGRLAVVVWRNDQKPIRPGRPSRGAVHPQAESGPPPEEEKNG